MLFLPTFSTIYIKEPAKMYFSEKQISMAVGMARLGLDYEQILRAVTLDRQDEKKINPIDVYLEDLDKKRTIDKRKQTN